MGLNLVSKMLILASIKLIELICEGIGFVKY